MTTSSCSYWLGTFECNPSTVYPKKYAHGFVVLCFVVVMQSFIMNSHEVFIRIHQGCFAGTGAIVRLPQCQWSKPDGYGKISQCITTTKHSKAKTVCIFLGIYCTDVNQVQVQIKYWCKSSTDTNKVQKKNQAETQIKYNAIPNHTITRYISLHWCHMSAIGCEFTSYFFVCATAPLD